MKLIDKDALVAEIENLLDKGRYNEEYDCAYRDGNNNALYALKNKLNTLEVKGVQEEPVSEELEEAAFDYAEDCKYEGGEKLLCVEHFKAGAKWQKQQDQSTIELAEDHAMFAGMNKMEQQMIAKAIDGQLENGEDYLRIKCLSTGCQPQDDGKLVKLIIIKED